MAENKPGRPREYASDADRVRAWRARQKQETASAAAEAELPTDPAEAAAALAQVLPLLRQEAGGALDRLSAVADRITGAVDLLGDPAAIDAHLRRAQVTADKVKADAADEIEKLRNQLEAALDDRANADVAAQAAEAAAAESATALAEAQREHAEQVQALRVAHGEELTVLAEEHAAVLDRWRQEMETAAAEHRDKAAEQHELVESLRRHNADLLTQIDQVRSESDRAAAAATASIERLEADLTEARTAVQSERSRADAARDELATTKADLATAQAQAAAARERAGELRDELGATKADLVTAQAQAATARERADELRAELAEARSASAATKDGERGTNP
ncbi:hypothetical protein [Rhodococcus sp. T7]|uniref:hypothetical protein n=1 Tax=Rhodococcus sp. T7 TaxID=627444 RepID=UPI0013C742BE|nr:hypothetical protein [Rhodococcus sp. T7]KAF0956907.1 hypothetical protein MLGJGCBP_09987 [Rhodococcus sp. T7]KAF0958675.1 hypothetical protein MLGJGCBP_08247 [Rhodococcus sp. T7]